MINEKHLTPRLEEAYNIILRSDANTKSIASEMKISVRTAQYYVNKLKKIYNCFSKEKLVRKIKGDLIC